MPRPPYTPLFALLCNIVLHISRLHLEDSETAAGDAPDPHFGLMAQTRDDDERPVRVREDRVID